MPMFERKSPTHGDIPMRVSRLWTDENGVKCVAIESEDRKRGTAMPMDVFRENYRPIKKHIEYQDMNDDAKEYARYWASLTGKSEREIYIPESLR